MREACCRFILGAAAAIVLLSGCKRRQPEADSPPPQNMVSPEAIAARREALTRGMQPVVLDQMSAACVGRRCVVTARTPEHADPPPPPLGMVYSMGATTLYAGEVHEVSHDSLTIRAAYPTSGNLKIIEIPREDIQAVHLGG